MNRVINIFSIIFLIIYFVLVSAVIYDFSMASFTFKGLPFKFEIFTGISFVLLLLGMVRIKRKWQGIRDMKKYEKFIFTKKITKTAMNFASLFSIAEIVVFLLSLYYASELFVLEETLITPMIVVLMVLLLESVIFLIRIRTGGESFRYGMDEKVIAFFQREMHLYYFTGLLRVELYQSDLINFTYRDDLNLSMPTNIIEKEDRVEFRNNLIEILEKRNVYIDDAFRQWE